MNRVDFVNFDLSQRNVDIKIDIADAIGKTDRLRGVGRFGGKMLRHCHMIVGMIHERTKLSNSANNLPGLNILNLLALETEGLISLIIYRLSSVSILARSS